MHAIAQPNKQLDENATFVIWRQEWAKCFSHQVPVEAPPEVRGRADVSEVVHGDDVDDGTDHTGGIFSHDLQHRLLKMLSLSRLHCALRGQIYQGAQWMHAKWTLSLTLFSHSPCITDSCSHLLNRAIITFSCIWTRV